MTATMTAWLLSLALYHAPVIYQQTGHNAKADAITRFDFDGDYIANNNWKNLDHYPTPAAVYSDVIESETHYFIFYAFFHPRDYSTICMPQICHEDDLEGALLTVQKDKTEFGKLVLVQTMAHNRIYTYTHPKFVNDRAALYVEWGGHGVYAFDPDKKEPIKLDSLSKVAPANPAENAPSPVQTERARYFIYSPGARSDDPGGDREGRFSYQLLSIHDEFWQQRQDVGEGRMFWDTYDYGGSRLKLGQIPSAFAGQKWTAGKANPPWAWYDSDRSDVKRGDWFLDPAFFVEQTLKSQKRTHKLSVGFSTEYIYHPYLK